MSESNGTAKMSLRRATQEVEITDENGRDVKLVVTEMSGLERDTYLDVQQRRVNFDASGKPVGVKTMVNIQADLICRCLVDRDGVFGEAGKLVAIDQVKQWPSSVQDELHSVCQKINRLDEKSKEEAKKV